MKFSTNNVAVYRANDPVEYPQPSSVVSNGNGFNATNGHEDERSTSGVQHDGCVRRNARRYPYSVAYAGVFAEYFAIRIIDHVMIKILCKGLP